MDECKQIASCFRACEGIQSRSWVGVMALTCCGIVVLLQRWVYVYSGCLSVWCTRVDLVGIHMPQCPERIGFQYGGQLGKHMYPLAKGLVEFGIVCHLGNENYLL